MLHSGSYIEKADMQLFSTTMSTDSNLLKIPLFLKRLFYALWLDHSQLTT